MRPLLRFPRLQAPAAAGLWPRLARLALIIPGLLAATTALAGPEPPRPGDVPDSPHPWRVWESQRKAAAVQLAGADLAPSSPLQERYDVHFYDLALDLDTTAEVLTGTVQTAATVVGDTPLEELVLDLAAEMTVGGVTADGEPAPWTHVGDVLTVTLPRAYSPGENVTVTVDYQGDPEAAGSAFGWSGAGGQPLVWTLSEPYGARTWWPCKDLNADKADSVDLHVTVADGMVVASNGTLAGQEPAPGGRTTFHWQSRYPIATYLVSVTAHPYTVFTDWYVTAENDSLPIVNYVVPAYEQEARSGYAATADMLAAFVEGYGPYPFMDEKYGHAHFPWGGGMEHQTCSSMIYWYYGQGLVAHELAHQWWGDLVTCKDFHHIWLNEGFATWSEAYWREQSEGVAGYRDEMEAAKYRGGGTIYVEDPSNFSSIFDVDLSYNKASWVVHMLRGALGDADFFAGLALYRERFAYGSADTEDLQTVMEEVSGRDLEAFFQQWIYGEYFPRYEFSYLTAPEGDDTRLQLRIEQVQSQGGIFTMPLHVRVTTDTGYQWVTVENHRQVQNYSMLIPGTAWTAELDPEEWVLRDVVNAGATGVPDRPARVSLAAHPNPFNPRTTLALEMPAGGPVRLTVHDAAGRLVRTLLVAEVPAGARSVVWDGRDHRGRAVAAGVYFAVAACGDQRATTRLTLVK